LADLQRQVKALGIPVIIVFEGWSASGKGTLINELILPLDPRGFTVHSASGPTEEETFYPFLWRFWAQLPKAGHIAIFDRTWYGRVLVERVEGFCTETQWRRAYREINAMEQQLVHFGTVLLKFWLHIDPDEQLRRFRQRQEMTRKQRKITDEDWRNRQKLDQYRDAVEEMLHRTTTPYAPWTIVESNCKWYARVKGGALQPTIFLKAISRFPFLAQDSPYFARLAQTGQSSRRVPGKILAA
jgi:polyphosphate kinase 2 (PPK2 family)